MSYQFKTTRQFAGNYVVKPIGAALGYVDGMNDRKDLKKADIRGDDDFWLVDVTYRDDLKGWIAAARWDRYLYSDPVSTFREAKQSAISMIEDGFAEERRRNAVTMQAGSSCS